MNFYTYQKESAKTRLPVFDTHPLVYPALGLADEAGEVLGKIKKILRDKNGIVSEQDRQELKKEIGDVQWYLAQLCTDLDIDMQDMAQSNLDKLSDRQSRNVLHGNGDNR